MSKYANIKSLLKHLIGTENVLNNNILFIDFTGSHEKAQFLSQLFYWSSRTKISGGWIAKRHSDWYDEIRIKSHSVRRFAKEFSDKGFLEIRLKKFDGVTMPHYRLDQDKLINNLLTFCKGNNLQGLQIVTPGVTNCQPSQGNKLSPSINIDYTETTTENKGANEFAAVSEKGKDVFGNLPDLKKKIGPKHYSALNEVSQDDKIASRFRALWPDGRFDLFTEWLEHRKDIRKHATGKAIMKLLETFEEYTPSELKAAIHKGVESKYTGLFPKKERQPRRERIEANLSAIFSRKPKIATA